MKDDKGRVLIAEDNVIKFELVRDLLGARGHEVEWVCGVREEPLDLPGLLSQMSVLRG